MKDKQVPLTAHLKELRYRVIVALGFTCLTTFSAFVFFREYLMHFIVAPLKVLGLNLIFIGVSEAFMAYLKVAFLAGLIIAWPIILWQILAFIIPALYRREKVALCVCTFLGTILFIGGVVFGYWFVLTPTLRILAIGFSGDFQASLTATHYLSFILRFLIPFGLSFEIPLVIYFLASLGVVSVQQLKRWRKYMLIICLVVAAVLTPPDVVSQSMLAAPMYLLFEVSIQIARWVEYRRQKKIKREGLS